MPTIGDAARGRFLLILVIGSFCLTMLAIDVASWWNAEEIHLFRMIARPLIVAALGAFALGGNRWARGLIAGWLGLMAVAFGGGAVMVVAAGKTIGGSLSSSQLRWQVGRRFSLHRRTSSASMTLLMRVARRRRRRFLLPNLAFQLTGGCCRRCLRAASLDRPQLNAVRWVDDSTYTHSIPACRSRKLNSLVSRRFWRLGARTFRIASATSCDTVFASVPTMS